MNNIVAEAMVKKDRIAYKYEYNNVPYIIETPRTPLNSGVEDGEIVQVLVGIMPIEGGKPSDGNWSLYKRSPDGYEEE